MTITPSDINCPLASPDFFRGPKLERTVPVWTPIKQLERAIEPLRDPSSLTNAIP